jgi:hypothetical protein
MLSLKVSDLHRAFFFNVVQIALDDLKAQNPTTAQMDTGALTVGKRRPTVVHCGVVQHTLVEMPLTITAYRTCKTGRRASSRSGKSRLSSLLFSLCERERMHP